MELNNKQARIEIPEIGIIFSGVITMMSITQPIRLFYDTSEASGKIQPRTIERIKTSITLTMDEVTYEAKM